MADQLNYLVWRGAFSSATLDALQAASDKNGGQQYGLSEGPVARYLLTKADISEILDLDEHPVNRELGPQVVVSDDKAIGILEGYELPKGTFALSVDAPLSLVEYAGNRNATPNTVSHDRRVAEEMIGAEALRQYAADGSHCVNVVIIDGGLDADYVQSLGYSGAPESLSKAVRPGTGLTKRASQRHANAVARNVLAIAPHAQLFDLNVLPDRIDSIDAYAGDILPDLLELAGKVRKSENADAASWVVVCAWGLMDTAYDNDTGTFARSRFHHLSTVFSYLATLGVDIVFSAGNNGLFWPDVYSGVRDRGPGRSIYGTNGLTEVLTVGAVDALGVWSGTSSQGPEPAGLRLDLSDPASKPDLCAPMGFHETYDRHAILAGTSGACATAAGVVASIRRRHPDLSSTKLFQIMRQTARREGFADGEDRSLPAGARLGSGVIDCRALIAAL